MGWGLLERSVGRAQARPLPLGGRWRALRRGWLIAVVLGGLGVLVPAGAASASPAGLLSGCSGFAGCSVGGYSTHGYQSYMWQSWWRMDPGNECTNYVAFVESTVYHVATPGYLLGDAGEWPASAASHGVLVNDTPSVGAVAVWYGGDAGIGYAGHVAVVEQVAPGGQQIVISQQHISADADGYEWTRMTRGGLANGWQQWPDVFIHFVTGTASAPPAANQAALGAAAPASDLLADGEFAHAAAWQVAPDSNFTTYPAGVTRTDPDGGTRFAATNTTSPGGGFFQDVPLQASPGESICTDAEVVTVGRHRGARGTMVLWLLGDGPAESAAIGFGPLSGGDSWTSVTACITATVAHAILRVQFYDAPGTPTLGVDGVDAHISLARDGSFVQASTSSWHPEARTAFSTPAPRTTSTVAYEAGHFAAASTDTAGGGIYQDIPLTIAPGESFCADARVVTVGARPGAGGEMVLWLLGDSAPEAAGRTFGGLPADSRWMPVSACVTAKSPHSFLRVQFYVAPGASRLGVDAVDVHRSLAGDSEFSPSAGSAWRVAAGSNFATYSGGGHATVALAGPGFGVANTTRPGGGIYQDLHYRVATGSSFCLDADVVTEGDQQGARGVMVIWLLGGSVTQVASTVFGPLAGGNSWTRISTCITATAPASDIRIQFYPAPYTPNLGIDLVDLR
jgi:surface antigen